MSEYAFDGNTIRLTEHGFKQWKKAYPAIPDLMAELQKADDYYTQNPPPAGQWFVLVSRWLYKEHHKALKQSTPQRGLHVPGGGYA